MFSSSMSTSSADHCFQECDGSDQKTAKRSAGTSGADRGDAEDPAGGRRLGLALSDEVGGPARVRGMHVAFSGAPGQHCKQGNVSLERGVH